MKILKKLVSDVSVKNASDVAIYAFEDMDILVRLGAHKFSRWFQYPDSFCLRRANRIRLLWQTCNFRGKLYGQLLPEPK